MPRCNAGKDGYNPVKMQSTTKQGGDFMNKKELKSAMARFGDTQSDLAAALGISRNTLSAKIHSRNASFTQPEISAIKNRYHLTCKEVDNIFFN